MLVFCAVCHAFRPYWSQEKSESKGRILILFFILQPTLYFCLSTSSDKLVPMAGENSEGKANNTSEGKSGWWVFLIENFSELTSFINHRWNKQLLQECSVSPMKMVLSFQPLVGFGYIIIFGCKSYICSLWRTTLENTANKNSCVIPPFGDSRFNSFVKNFHFECMYI